VTQQYIVGKFSALLGGLEPTAREPLGDVVGKLRREVECSALTLLPQLAREALKLTDVVCWCTLDRGDVHGFCRCAETARALREFSASANLLS
jgi:hypothetical protein